jgi:ABC-2 type transport system permease protein
MIASGLKQIESFQVVMQFSVLPMFFLSGAIFPLSRLPAWLRVLTRLDPLTYAVEPMRRAVIRSLSAPASDALRRWDPGVTWSGWHVPVGLDVALVAGFALGALLLATLRFGHQD